MAYPMHMADTVNKDIADKFKDILGPMDPARDREVREILVTARVGMLLRASFFGNLATRLTKWLLANQPKTEAEETSESEGEKND